nr:hypothetical protein [Tanacetum cinerariifolium]
MAVRVPLVMSPGLSAGMAEVVAMSDSVFRKRFRSSYNSSPSPALPVRKRYRGTSELILCTDSEEDEEVEECSDSDRKSENVKDEAPTAENVDHVAEDEGLAAGVDGPGINNESYGLDGESHGVDDESHGLDDESYGIDGEGREYDDHRLVHDMLLQQTVLQCELHEMRDRVTVLELERDCRERGANRKMLNREWSQEMLERVVVIKLES